MPSISLDSIVNSVLKIGSDDDPSRDITLAVLVDESLDPEFAAYAREALRPTSSNVTVRVGSYFDEPVDPGEGYDLAIVLANSSPWTGSVYTLLEEREVPTVVVAQNLATLIERTEEAKTPIDYADILAPEVVGVSALPFADIIAKVADAGAGVADFALDMVGRKIPQAVIGRPLVSESVGFTLPPVEEGEDLYSKLFGELADWVMANCDSVRAPFASSFGFAQSAEVGQIARRTAFENAVTGAVFFIPGADFPVMTLNQLKMLVQIERSYGYGIDKQLAVEAAVVVLVALISRSVAHNLCEKAPMLSWIIKTGFGYFITLAMGKLITAHCANGRELPEVVTKQLEKFAPKLPVKTTAVNLDD